MMATCSAPVANSCTSSERSKVTPSVSKSSDLSCRAVSEGHTSVLLATHHAPLPGPSGIAPSTSYSIRGHSASRTGRHEEDQVNKYDTSATNSDDDDYEEDLLEEGDACLSVTMEDMPSFSRHTKPKAHPNLTKGVSFSVSDYDVEGQGNVDLRMACCGGDAIDVNGLVDNRHQDIDLDDINFIPDTDQLTITSSGRKKSSYKIERNPNRQISSSSDEWPEVTVEHHGHSRLTMAPHPHPHTITCRPISESSSVAKLSLASSCSSDPNAPFCKICHLNAKAGDPLISPCRCAGTMQFIHCGCLMVCFSNQLTSICTNLIV